MDNPLVSSNNKNMRQIKTNIFSAFRRPMIVIIATTLYVGLKFWQYRMTRATSVTERLQFSRMADRFIVRLYRWDPRLVLVEKGRMTG